MTYDPWLVCSTLHDEGVRFVLIGGGFAATIHGSPLPTSDVDIVPARDDENLERLARALTRLHARLRTEAGPVDVRIDGWNEGAVDVEIGPGLIVRIGGLDDIIDSKRAAARPKDQHGLPYLESLRDEIAGQREVPGR